MRKIEFDVYTLEELPEDVQEIAIENCREDEGRWHAECIASDYRASLREFEKVFNIARVRIDGSSHGYWCDLVWDDRYHVEPMPYRDENGEPIYLRNLHGKLLHRYLRNNVFPIAGRKEYYLWGHNDENGKTKTRTSRITYNRDDDYALTGTWCDYELVKPFLDWMQHPDNTTTYEELAEKACSNFLSAWEKDEEWGYSDEAVREEIIAHDTEFTANGKPY